MVFISYQCAMMFYK